MSSATTQTRVTSTSQLGNRDSASLPTEPAFGKRCTCLRPTRGRRRYRDVVCRVSQRASGPESRSTARGSRRDFREVQLQPSLLGNPIFWLRLVAYGYVCANLIRSHGVALGFDDRTYSAHDLLSSVDDSSITTQVDAHAQAFDAILQRGLGAPPPRASAPIEGARYACCGGPLAVRSYNSHRLAAAAALDDEEQLHDVVRPDGRAMRLWDGCGGAPRRREDKVAPDRRRCPQRSPTIPGAVTWPATSPPAAARAAPKSKGHPSPPLSRLVPESSAPRRWRPSRLLHRPSARSRSHGSRSPTR
jgi:hypothetical protein